MGRRRRRIEERLKKKKRNILRKIYINYYSTIVISCLVSLGVIWVGVGLEVQNHDLTNVSFYTSKNLFGPMK